MKLSRAGIHPQQQDTSVKQHYNIYKSVSSPQLGRPQPPLLRRKEQRIFQCKVEKLKRSKSCGSPRDASGREVTCRNFRFSKFPTLLQKIPWSHNGEKL